MWRELSESCRFVRMTLRSEDAAIDSSALPQSSESIGVLDGWALLEKLGEGCACACESPLPMHLDVLVGLCVRMQFVR